MDMNRKEIVCCTEESIEELKNYFKDLYVSREAKVQPAKYIKSKWLLFNNYVNAYCTLVYCGHVVTNGKIPVVSVLFRYFLNISEKNIPLFANIGIQNMKCYEITYVIDAQIYYMKFFHTNYTWYDNVFNIIKDNGNKLFGVG